jgi:RHS repeat-associated protein
VTGQREHDRADRIMGITYGRGDTSLASFAYTRTDAGLLASATPGGGAPGSEEAYAYTANGQLKSTGGAQGTDTWAYDAADRPSRLPDGTALAYDAADQLTTVTPPTGAATTYGFDGRGNRTSATTGSDDAARYTYDQANRLTAFTSPSGEATSYAYDGDGLRAGKTPAGAPARTMSWDLVTGSVPVLLTDGASQYVYGPGDAPIEQVSADGTPTYLHGDHLGSVRLLTDAAGAAAGTARFDAYGTATTTGTTTPFGFAGQYTDAETGFQYLRARYYDPSSAQFLTVDPLQAVSRSRYGYASGNPLR